MAGESVTMSCQVGDAVVGSDEARRRKTMMRGGGGCERLWMIKAQLYLIFLSIFFFL